jgi:hypothetical protein
MLLSMYVFIACLFRSRMLRRLQRELGVKNGTVWLKGLEDEILSETPGMVFQCTRRPIGAYVLLFRDKVSRDLYAPRRRQWIEFSFRD